MITGRLLAKEAARRGVSVPALLDAEVTAKVGLVTEPEIDSFYHENKAQLKGEDAAIRKQIRAHLHNQKLAANERHFFKLSAQTRRLRSTCSRRR